MENGQSSYFNRTILELKQGTRHLCKFMFSILIEPFWNWNKSQTGKFPFASIYFNRTILELKPNPNFTVNSSILNFNRTILELKPQKRAIVFFAMIYFNRTILELKHITYVYAVTVFFILIEPFWNWNELLVKVQNLISEYFNRTILELKRLSWINCFVYCKTF